MIKRVLQIICFLIAQFYFASQTVFASDEFETSFSAIYEIGLDGVATVTQNIKLTNKLSNVYATQYALEIGSTRIENVFAFDNAGNAINHKETLTDNKTVIVVNFDKKTVGKGQTLDFTIRYKNTDASQKTGKILEINIPKVSPESQIDTYEVVLRVPGIFGTPKIITPSTFQTSQIGKYTSLQFSSGEIMRQGITAIFGDMQVYDFTLTYNLENPTVSEAITQIALPPDTPYQKMYYEDFSKFPEKIVEDEDNNWIATYRLEPKEKVSVKVKGAAVIYLEPIINTPPVSQKTLSKYTRSQKFWDTTNEEVKALAIELKTPENIYNYLVSNFTYNYDRINSGIGRLGAVDALKHPDNAICTEFTDTFVALARAAGIPAREVNGYAHTENSVLKPLSLIQDVLHSWPEYYDQSKNQWVPVDPTWGNTTGGVDYFNHLDFNHFAFAFHGTSSERPYPAGYYKFDSTESKDLQITFGQDAPIPKKEFVVSFEDIKINPFSSDTTVKVQIKNSSNQALYRLPIEIRSQDATILSENSLELSSFLPLAEEQITVKLRPSKKTALLTVTIENIKYEHQIKNSDQVRQIIIFALYASVGCLLTYLAYRTGRLLVSRWKK